MTNSTTKSVLQRKNEKNKQTLLLPPHQARDKIRGTCNYSVRFSSLKYRFSLASKPSLPFSCFRKGKEKEKREFFKKEKKEEKKRWRELRKMTFRVFMCGFVALVAVAILQSAPMASAKSVSLIGNFSLNGSSVVLLQWKSTLQSSLGTDIAKYLLEFSPSPLTTTLSCAQPNSTAVAVCNATVNATFPDDATATDAMKSFLKLRVDNLTQTWTFYNTTGANESLTVSNISASFTPIGAFVAAANITLGGNYTRLAALSSSVFLVAITMDFQGRLPPVTIVNSTFTATNASAVVAFRMTTLRYADITSAITTILAWPNAANWINASNASSLYWSGMSKADVTLQIMQSSAAIVVDTTQPSTTNVTTFALANGTFNIGGTARVLTKMLNASFLYSAMAAVGNDLQSRIGTSKVTVASLTQPTNASYLTVSFNFTTTTVDCADNIGNVATAFESTLTQLLTASPASFLGNFTVLYTAVAAYTRDQSTEEPSAVTSFSPVVVVYCANESAPDTNVPVTLAPFHLKVRGPFNSYANANNGSVVGLSSSLQADIVAAMPLLSNVNMSAPAMKLTPVSSAESILAINYTATTATVSSLCAANIAAPAMISFFQATKTVLTNQNASAGNYVLSVTSSHGGFADPAIVVRMNFTGSVDTLAWLATSATFTYAVRDDILRLLATYIPSSVVFSGVTLLRENSTIAVNFTVNVSQPALAVAYLNTVPAGASWPNATTALFMQVRRTVTRAGSSLLSASALTAALWTDTTATTQPPTLRPTPSPAPQNATNHFKLMCTIHINGNTAVLTRLLTKNTTQLKTVLQRDTSIQINAYVTTETVESGSIKYTFSALFASKTTADSAAQKVQNFAGASTTWLLETTALYTSEATTAEKNSTGFALSVSNVATSVSDLNDGGKKDSKAKYIVIAVIIIVIVVAIAAYFVVRFIMQKKSAKRAASKGTEVVPQSYAMQGVAPGQEGRYSPTQNQPGGGLSSQV